MNSMYVHDEQLVQKWGPVLEGIKTDYAKRVTAQLLENQAKAIVEQKMINEADTGAATTVGALGTFAKFAFPLVRRVFPELIASNFVGVQPMQGPVSQVFYLGHSRHHKDSGRTETMYSKFNLTPYGMVASGIGSASGNGTSFNTFTGTTGGLDGDAAISGGFDVSNLLPTKVPEGYASGYGWPSSTMGGRMAAFPNANYIGGYLVSAGEKLAGDEFPELSIHIEQEAVISKTRKMRALWTLEASQDLKAYHNLDLERELTDLLSKELQLEIDRELIEDLRMIAYGFKRGDGNAQPATLGGTDFANMDSDYISLGTFSGLQANASLASFVPAQFAYNLPSTVPGTAQRTSNVFVCDLTQSTLSLNPRHVGEVYANLLAVINLASQDIFKTTLRGPGSWLLTSPLIASLLESSAKLEGGIDRSDAPTNIGNASIQFKGKFMGRYDLYVDPMYPDDEIMVGYKGANAMDAGFIYAPYIPLQQLPTVTDPITFQPRKGILTRYGKVQVEPSSRFYRIIRIIGPTSSYLLSPFARNTKFNNVTI
jgi:hypothetical protein